MNLWEIGLFHIVLGDSKVPMIMIMRFGENNVLGPIYINFRGGTWFTLPFWFIIHKN